MIEPAGDRQSKPQPLGVDEGVLFRQVHPKLFNQGEPTSVAFRPTPEDEGQLSVDRSSIVTAEQAFIAYLDQGLASAGSWGLHVDEVNGAGLGVFPDPIDEGNDAGLAANPAHAFVEFGRRERKEAEAAARILKRAANARGRLHPPADPS